MRFAHAPFSVLLVGLFATRAAVAADDELSLDLAEKTTLVVRKIPKGTFIEGSPTNEPQREADEAARKVTITKPFWLGRTLVTRSQFSLFVSETRHITDAEKGQSGGFGIDGRSGTLVNRREFNWRNPGFVQRDDDPVVLVSFGDANAFVAWVARKTNRHVRLPTEAEWEYAARAGTTTPWFAAASETEALQIGWFRLSASGTTHPVATRKPNAFGLFDMAGNVQEWCRDVYAPYPPGEAVDPETTSTAETERRVLRGGSWLKDPKRGRSAARNKGVPSSRSAENGFRVAIDDDPTAPVSSSAIAPLPPSSAALDADAGPSFVAPAPQRSEGGTAWSIWLAPLVAAALSVGWVLARRGARRGEPIPRVASSTLRMSRPAEPRIMSTPVPRVSEPPPSPRVSMPPSVSIVAQPTVPVPLPSSTRRMAAAPPPPPVSSTPAPSVPIDRPSAEAIPLALALPPQPLTPSPVPSSSRMTGPPAPPSTPASSRELPRPEDPDEPAQPPPAPFPLAASMLPPPSSRAAPPSGDGRMTGPPSPPSSSSMTGPPSPPRDSVPAAPLATLLAALSSRPLLPPSVRELPESDPDPDVTAPYPAISSSGLVDDPDVTAPFKVIPPEQPLPEPSSDEGPPSPRT